MRNKKIITALYSLTGLFALSLTQLSAAEKTEAATEADQAMEEIMVFGRGAELIGIADSAGQGYIGGADLLVRPMLKVAELLESMPGMVAVQHSGSGKANQYFLRGFNLDHGTDYTALIDGMPWNLRSHGHGQGYLDVNGLIPEVVERIDYRKGPYFADLGDFSLAGSSTITTIDRLNQPFIAAETGQYGWGRLALGHSMNLGTGTLTLVADAKQYDGPWKNPESLQHKALWGKYLTDTDYGQLAITLSGYTAKWNPTEQVPERAIGSTVCADRFCSLDDSAMGKTSRWIVTGQLAGDDWNAGFYAQYYDWAMESNPTYDFQIHQFDERYTLGGHGRKNLVGNERADVRIGAEFRHDDANDVGLSHYRKGEFVEAISDNAIAESSVGAYIDSTLHITPQLRALAGLRGDYYRFEARAQTDSSFSGKATDSQISPKLGLAYAVRDNLELYGNWGKGFHSNDARGVISNLDPVPGLSEGTGYEVGARTTLGDIKLTYTYWWLDQDSELIFVGDSNSVEPKGGSQRDGYEVTLFWQPIDGLGIDAVYTRSKARYTDNDEGPYVENAIEEAAQLGISLSRGNWEGSARLRYMGAYALSADNRERSAPLTTLNMRGAYSWSDITLYAEVINLLNSDRKEITYFYPAYVAGLDAGASSDDIDCDALDCTMSRTAEPRTLRVGIKYRF